MDTLAGMALVERLLPDVWHWLLAFGLALARPFALLSVTPLFTRLQISGLLRGGVAAALAAPLLPHLVPDVVAADTQPFTLLLLFAKEAILGAVIGFALGVPFWALGVAGDVLDNQRGASQGRVADDPTSGDDLSITGTLLVLTGVTLFVLTGGLRVMAQLLYTSWAVWPPLGAFPTLSPAVPSLILALLDSIMRAGLELAAPVIIAMLLADLTLVIIGRFVSQLRVDDFALTGRNLVFTLFLPLYCAYLIVYMRQDQAVLPQLMDTLRPVLAPAP